MRNNRRIANEYRPTVHWWGFLTLFLLLPAEQAFAEEQQKQIEGLLVAAQADRTSEQCLKLRRSARPHPLRTRTPSRPHAHPLPNPVLGLAFGFSGGLRFEYPTSPTLCAVPIVARRPPPAAWHEMDAKPTLVGVWLALAGVGWRWHPV